MSAVRESADEAMARNMATFALSAIRQCQDPRVRFDALTPGDLIRHASEWWTIVVKRDDRMSLISEDGRREWVHPCAGESFLRWDEGF